MGAGLAWIVARALSTGSLKPLSAFLMARLGSRTAGWEMELSARVTGE